MIGPESRIRLCIGLGVSVVISAVGGCRSCDFGGVILRSSWKIFWILPVRQEPGGEVTQKF